VFASRALLARRADLTVPRHHFGSAVVTARTARTAAAATFLELHLTDKKVAADIIYNLKPNWIVT
jgi:hypothetical protein